MAGTSSLLKERLQKKVQKLGKNSERGIFVDFGGHSPGGIARKIPLFLLHGWCCDWQAMVPLADALPEYPRRLASLAGHGLNYEGRNRDKADLSIAGQATAMLAIAPEGRFVVVGHSMGAQVALEMAVRAPERVAGAVLLEPAQILPTPKARANAEGMAEKLRLAAPAGIIRAFAARQFVRPLDPEVAAALVERMARTPPEVARQAWAAMLAFEGAAALQKLKVPTLVIAIERTMNRLVDLRRASPCITTGQVVGAGHMLQYEVPEQLRAMLERWLFLAGLAEAGVPKNGE